MAELELQTRISQFFLDIQVLENKIEEHEAAVDYDTDKLKPGHKGAITRWRNKITEIKGEIAAAKTEIATIRDMKKENTSGQGQSEGGSSQISKDVKNLTRDIQSQPKFCPPMDVAVFVRSMNMIWNSHVKHKSNLENDFVNLCEGHMDQIYRIPLQRYVETNGRFTNWMEMKTYLVDTHRSCTTIFQELTRLNLPMRGNENVRGSIEASR